MEKHGSATFSLQVKTRKAEQTQEMFTAKESASKRDAAAAFQVGSQNLEGYKRTCATGRQQGGAYKEILPDIVGADPFEHW